MNDKSLAAHEMQTVQFQVRLHPTIKGMLELLTQLSMRSMSALCLFLLQRSFETGSVRETAVTLDKAVRLMRPNTLRLSLFLHTSIANAARANSKSMNAEINARLFDQAADLLESPMYNRRATSNEWLILQYLSEQQGEALRRRATDQSMDIFQYAAMLMLGELNSASEEA
ncbi:MULTISPECIES: hypothetical protein [Pseudomonas]|nr:MULTISPECIES: hypothetical protein [Pseudomonas]